MTPLYTFWSKITTTWRKSCCEKGVTDSHRTQSFSTPFRQYKQSWVIIVVPPSPLMYRQKTTVSMRFPFIQKKNKWKTINVWLKFSFGRQKGGIEPWLIHAFPSPLFSAIRFSSPSALLLTSVVYNFSRAAAIILCLIFCFFHSHRVHQLEQITCVHKRRVICTFTFYSRRIHEWGRGLVSKSGESIRVRFLAERKYILTYLYSFLQKLH